MDVGEDDRTIGSRGEDIDAISVTVTSIRLEARAHMRSSLHRVRRIIHNPSSLQYYARPILKYRRMASTGASVRYFFFGANESSIQRLLLQFGLQDPTLIRTQGFIGGKWVDAKHGDKIVVTSELVPFPFTLEFFR